MESSFTGQSTIFSRNYYVTKLLELCIQPETQREMEAILLNFWKRYDECISASEDFSEFDVSGMYVLDYVYKHNDMPLASVSRSICVYMEQIILSYLENNRNVLFGVLFNRWFYEFLYQRQNFDSLVGKENLVRALLSSISSANFGLSKFMMKFGLQNFIFQESDAGKEFLKMVVDWFNLIHKSGDIGERQAAQRISIQFDDLINLIKESDVSFRRSMVIFCNICIIAEYRKSELFEIPNHEEVLDHRNCVCKSKLSCLDMIMNTTTETKITIKDIENFLVLLNPIIGKDVAESLAETCRKLFCEEHRQYQPRSLKDLARCGIRASLQSSIVMPEQVHQLPIPATLKDFLLFDHKEIWDLLKEHQQWRYSVLRYRNLPMNYLCLSLL